MSCSCHINPPCGYCEQTYECDGCGKLKHPDEDGQNEFSSMNLCDSCTDDTFICTDCGMAGIGTHSCQGRPE